MPPSPDHDLEAPSAPDQIELLTLLLVFLRLGTMTFGGNVQSWVYREVVERRAWIDEREFITGLGMSMVLPGANPVNLALYVGMRLRGGIGGFVAVTAMVLPAFCLILLLGAFYRDFSRYPAVHFVLAGLAASGVGLTIAAALRVAVRLPRDVITLLIALLVFVASGVLRLPMIWIVAIGVPLSILRCYLRNKENEDAVD